MQKSACLMVLALSLAAAGPALSLSSAALADTANALQPDQAAALCSKLSDQFNNLKPFKEGLPYWSEASDTFKSGQTACDNGKPVKGAKAMQTAIYDLYVAPDKL